MLAKVLSSAVIGIDAYLVEVEVDIMQGLPSFTTVGLPEAAVKEGGEVKDVQYYKTMLNELTDALDNAISHKIKLTRYIDNLLKKKYKTYVRLKSDD